MVVAAIITWLKNLTKPIMKVPTCSQIYRLLSAIILINIAAVPMSLQFISPGITFGSLLVDSMQQAGIEQGIFKDSLLLRDQKYYNIYVFPGRCSYEDRLFGDTLFYSESEGIVGLKFTDGNLWTKI